MGAPLRVRALYNREGKRSGDPRGQPAGLRLGVFPAEPALDAEVPVGYRMVRR